MFWALRMVNNYRTRYIEKDQEFAVFALAAFRWCIALMEPVLAAEFLLELHGAGHDAAVQAILNWLELRPWVAEVYGFMMPDLD